MANRGLPAPAPSSSTSTIPARKTAFVRRQVRLLAYPIRPSPRWARVNTDANPVSVPAARPSRPGSTEELERNQPDFEPEIEASPNTLPSQEPPSRTLVGTLPADVVSSVIKIANLRLKKHITIAYPTVAIRHVAEQIDQLYWNAGAVVEPDRQLKALEFRERVRRHLPPSTPQDQQNDTEIDNMYDYTDEDDENDNDTADPASFPPLDPRSNVSAGTHILPRVGDDFTHPEAFKTLPSKWDPNLDHTSLDQDNPTASADSNSPSARYLQLYTRLRSLHDRHAQLKLRAAAYCDLAHLVEPLVGPSNQDTSSDSSFPLQSIQPNLVTRDSALQEEMKTCRTLSLKLRARLAGP